MASAPERTIKDMQVAVESPHLQKALARAEELVSRAQFNEAIALIEELEREVLAMPVARRFSHTKKPSESQHGVSVETMNPSLRNLSEAEYKRQTILIDLRKIKDTITIAVQNLSDVVMNIEATKTD